MSYDAFLKQVPLFAELPDQDLEQLCQMVWDVTLDSDETLFYEGDKGDKAYVIKEGELDIVKRAPGGREVLLAVLKSGDILGEMALLESTPRTATVRARTDARLLVITGEQLDSLFTSSPRAARAMLSTIASRWHTTETMLRQSEKMAQLGTLSAGMAHELNNPAAAAARGAAQLRDAITKMQRTQMAFINLDFTQHQLDLIDPLDERAQASAANPSDLDSMAQSDLEYELETWLESREIENPWEMAPSLANMGYNEQSLSDLCSNFQRNQLMAVLTWLVASYTVYSLLEEIGQGAGRISEIVKALKQYVYLDQAPVQAIDVHEGLDNTLVLLRSKLKQGIQVHREYDHAIPRIEAYGSELNQVWTNIIDNAIDAMDGHGVLTLRTVADGECIVVEIEDNGPGIPPEIVAKIFDPFFTTKAVGKGTGLGLNITYNIVAQKHRGDIKVISEPGKTVFRVILPRSQSERPATTQ